MPRKREPGGVSEETAPRAEVTQGGSTRPPWPCALASPKPSSLHYFLQLAVYAFLLPLYCESLENNIGHYASLHPQSQGKAWRYLGLLHCPAPGGPTGVGAHVTSPRSRWPAHGKGMVLLPSASFQEVPCHRRTPPSSRFSGHSI